MALANNLAYRFPARVVGAVELLDQSATDLATKLGGVLNVGLNQGPTLTTNGDTIRADEGQPILIGSISSLGKNVSIHSPLGGIQGTTTTTVVTSTTITRDQGDHDDQQHDDGHRLRHAHGHRRHDHRDHRRR